jgi:hypothetical protein
MQPSPSWNEPPRDPSGAMWRARLSSTRMLFGGAVLALIAALTGVLAVSNGGSSSGGLASWTPTATAQDTSGALATPSAMSSAQITVTPRASTPTATPHQTAPTATPRPTMTPSPTATPLPPLTITITCATISMTTGGDLCVHTAPNTSIELTVAYCSGGDASYDYIYDTSDAQGNYEWTWTLDTTCRPTPNATIYVVAFGSGRHADATEDVPLT